MTHYLFYHLIVVALSTMRLLLGLDKIARSRMFRINMVSLSWSSINKVIYIYLVYYKVLAITYVGLYRI